MKTMVAAGVGFMPCFMGDASLGLQRVIDPDPQWNSDLWILTHPDLRQVPRVRAVMDHFAEELATLRPLFEGTGQRAGAKPALKANGDGLLAAPLELPVAGVPAAAE